MWHRVLVIVPAYNEQETIAATMDDLLNFRSRSGIFYDILVVDDGSSDDTAAIVRRYRRVALASLPFNVGIGGAVQTGFLYAQRQGYDVAVQFDADGQHLAQELPLLISPILSGQCDVSIGSRFLSFSSRKEDKDRRNYRPPLLRRIGILFFHLLNSALLGKPITDNTSGFRAFNRKALGLLVRYYPQDYPEPESVIFLGRNGVRILEVAVSMQERRAGFSSIRPHHSIVYMVKVSLAILFEALRPRMKFGSSR